MVLVRSDSLALKVIPGRFKTPPLDEGWFRLSVRSSTMRTTEMISPPQPPHRQQVFGPLLPPKGPERHYRKVAFEGRRKPETFNPSLISTAVTEMCEKTLYLI